MWVECSGVWGPWAGLATNMNHLRGMSRPQEVVACSRFCRAAGDPDTGGLAVSDVLVQCLIWKPVARRHCVAEDLYGPDQRLDHQVLLERGDGARRDHHRPPGVVDHHRDRGRRPTGIAVPLSAPRSGPPLTEELPLPHHGLQRRPQREHPASGRKSKSQHCFSAFLCPSPSSSLPIVDRPPHRRLDTLRRSRPRSISRPGRASRWHPDFVDR
jgi:hypothetical protein